MTEPVLHILSTAPIGTELLEQARLTGILLDALPFIETRPVMGDSMIRQIHHLTTQQLIVIFTSVNAVEPVVACLREKAAYSVMTSGPDWQIFCIGAATRQKVEDYFGAAHIAGTAVSAAALAHCILSFLDKEVQEREETFEKKAGIKSERQVCFFCGDQRRDELPQILGQASVKVNELVVYATIPIHRKTDKAYDGIIFFSPSAVHSFFSVNSAGPGTVLFAIGDTTAAAIREHATGSTIVISESPAKEALVRLAMNYLKNNQRG